MQNVRVSRVRLWPRLRRGVRWVSTLGEQRFHNVHMPALDSLYERGHSRVVCRESVRGRNRRGTHITLDFNVDASGIVEQLVDQSVISILARFPESRDHGIKEKRRGGLS